MKKKSNPGTIMAATDWRFQPVGDKLVVRPIAEGERKVGSLVIPDTAKERPSMGVVVAVSVDIGVNDELHEGDRVVYGKYSGHELTIDEQSYVILKESDILTIIHEDL